MKPSLRFAFVALIAVLVAVPSARAANIYDWNADSGVYSNSTSWSSGGPPTSGDVANFYGGYNGITNSPTVIFDRDESVRNVSVVHDNFVTFNLNGHTYTATNTVGENSYIGGSAGSSTGYVHVTGGGLWDVGPNFLVLSDGNGPGSLTLDSGVTVRSFRPLIGASASAANASILWVKNGAVYEFTDNNSGQLGNANNHAATITGAGVLRPTSGLNNWQFDSYGVIAPGDAGTGTLTLQDAAVYAHNGTKLAMEIGGTNAGAFDQLLLSKVTVGGYDYISFDPGTSLELNFLPSYTATGTNTFNLVVGGNNQIVNWANLTTSFSPLSNTNFTYSLNLIDLDATHDALQLTVVSLIPEPSALVATVAGVMLLAFVRRRRA